MSTAIENCEIIANQKLILARLDQLQAQITYLIDNKPPQFLSVKSAAKMADIPEPALRKRIERRQITIYRDEQGQVRLTAKDIERSMTKYPSIDEAIK